MSFNPCGLDVPNLATWLDTPSHHLALAESMEILCDLSISLLVGDDCVEGVLCLELVTQVDPNVLAARFI